MVIFFGDDGVSRDTFNPPYSLTVRAGEGQWTVRCEPIEGVTGFTVEGDGSQHMRFDVPQLDIEMECEFWHRPTAVTRTYGSVRLWGRARSHASTPVSIAGWDGWNTQVGEIVTSRTTVFFGDSDEKTFNDRRVRHRCAEGGRAVAAELRAGNVGVMIMEFLGGALFGFLIGAGMVYHRGRSQRDRGAGSQPPRARCSRLTNCSTRSPPSATGSAMRQNSPWEVSNADSR